MVNGKLLHRIVVWPTYEDAVAAEADAASEDCKRTNKLTVWNTYEQAAAHTSVDSGGELPAPPEGFHYLVNADGKYLVNADGAYILADGD